ncbi:hypothetical protein DRF59_14155 [Chryseobacterium flavum]|uniref:Bacteriocin n=1 Tax=Chryseobacterium flavum TaxID=415851 RepID=A0A3D9CJL1_9FLAO|nr:hypothetical protein DRF59_14155 [Chryseobacterium flavum]
MKNLKKLSREKLRSISGGKSCAASCSDGSMVYVSSCTSCISYSGGAACHNSHEQSIYVENC